MAKLWIWNVASTAWKKVSETNPLPTILRDSNGDPVGGSDNRLKTGSVFEEMYTESDLDENDQITFEDEMSECEVVNMDDSAGLDFSVGDKDVSLEAKNVDTNGLPNLYHINETYPAFTVVDFSDTTTPTFVMIVRK